MNFRLSFLFFLSCAVALAADRRIKDIVTTATEPAADDYVAIDGATNGTRRILGLNLRPVTLSGSNTFLSGASVTFAAGSTLTISGVLSGTPTGGTLNLSSVTVTLGSVSANSFDLSGATITGTIGVTNGGTGRATGTTAYALLATGTTPTGAQQSLPAGATTDILVGGGASALPVWTTSTGSGAPVRATSPTITSPILTVSAALATDDTYSGLAVAGLNAGATIAQWEAVYLDGSSTWQLADANGSGTFPAVGLAVAAYSNTNAAIVVTHGTVRNDAWAWTPGGVVYLSTTAGGLTQTAPSTSGDKVQQIGRALTADILLVNINSEYLTVQ